MRPWIRATSQWQPAEDGDPAEKIEVCASFDFPPVTACALAPGAGIAFIAERLGSVARIDMRSGREPGSRLTIRRERPLQMACSADGRYVAIAFESGAMDVFQIEPGAEGLPAERPAWSARCRLPEFEPPALEFSGHALWWQDETGDAVGCEAASGKGKHRLKPPAESPGAELAAATCFPDVQVLAWRKGGGSSVLSVADTTGQDDREDIEGSVVISMISRGERAVAVSFADNRLRVYSVRPALELCGELSLDAPAACLAEHGSRIWWVSRDGELCSWVPPAVHAERILSPGRTFPGARAIALFPDDEGLILTTHSGAAFRRSGTAGRRAVVQAAAPRPGGYAALATTRGRTIVIDGAEKRTTALAAGVPSGSVRPRVDGREVGFIFAVDPDGYVLVSHNEVGGFVDPSSGDFSPCELPEGSVAAVASSGGGFWLADLLGRIFFLDRRGNFRKAAVVPAKLPGPPRLWAWESLVVWTGLSIASDASSTADPICLQVFFRETSGRLERLGSREYAAADGIFRTLSWDRARGRLIGIWQGRGHGAAVAKIGTPDELMAASEKELLIPDLDTDCESATVGSRSRRIFVLTADGAVRCFDADTLAPVATIAGSLPFTCLAEHVPGGGGVVAVAGRERVLLLKLEEGGG